MKVNVIIFGQLTEITGSSNIAVEDSKDTEELLEQLNRMYPRLAGATYVIAVNNKIIPGNTSLNQNSVIALLPPFSGG